MEKIHPNLVEINSPLPRGAANREMILYKTLQQTALLYVLPFSLHQEQ